jgi:aspartyl-tRNA(Asn)/glutamyl-tRNA(Gln) amidotransferase subunit C
MAIDRETVRHIAKLARLALTDEEEERFMAQLGEILGYVDQLKELDTTGLEPTSHSVPLQNVLRPDEHRPDPSPGDLLAAAPEVEQGMFRVPKIL